VIAPNKRLGKLLSKIFEGAAVQARGKGPHDSLRFSIHGGFGEIQLRVIWIGDGWPADVQSALDRLGPAEPWPGPLVLAARRMSPGAIRLLTESGANWADEAGNARIQSPGTVVIRQGNEEEEVAPSLSWSPSAIAVAEGLLSRDWPDGIKTTALANLVQWSPGRVSNVLQRFDEEGWTVKYGPQRGSAALRELANSAGLLQAWAGAAAADRDQRLAHRTMRNPLGFLEDELAAALDEEVRWALGGWAAAHLLAPIAGAVPSLQIYVHEDDFERPLDRAIAAAGLANVAEGGRVAFLPAHPSVLSLAQSRDRLNVVSAPRVYADLLAVGGRGEDAAMHLRAELLDDADMGPGRQSPPGGLLAWERACQTRLGRLAQDRPDLAEAYGRGTWSASYRLIGAAPNLDAKKLLAILREVAGHETGWPPWWIPTDGRGRPRPVDGMVECWLSDGIFADASHADYWRADPGGRLCLIRAYQEDSTSERMAPRPQERLDVTLPIWRTGECLLHAGRLARRLDATSVQFMMRWSGLAGRVLGDFTHPPSRFLPPTPPSLQDEVVSFVELDPHGLDAGLERIVRELVEPLYTSFDFYEPPPSIYEEELAAMRHRA
jgi:hypothetical protein